MLFLFSFINKTYAKKQKRHELLGQPNNKSKKKILFKNFYRIISNISPGLTFFDLPLEGVYIREGLTVESGLTFFDLPPEGAYIRENTVIQFLV